ncbi:MAG TPA: FAD/NAD(P)-binding oxidoreductase [Kosmotogaceae bacterium]|nr:MAG: FAD dependent oxidoreductase [Thermotogales bacterium 46_20]HAA85437.1 FAD/NAD(P)-binding oxidoreductase [Kosmotogaceae bacterium]
MQIVVIGGGICGSLILRKLSALRNVSAVLVEAKSDLGQGVTKANSAIVHGGYDDPHGTVRAALCVKGNDLFADLCEELNVPFKRTGSLVVARDNPDEIKKLEELLENGKKNGARGLRIIGKDELKKIEPNLSEDYKHALHCSSAGITEPWMIAIAAANIGRMNGARVITGDPVTGCNISDGHVEDIILESGTRITADCVINATGVHYNEVASIFGVVTPPVKLRKGQYILLDKLAGGMIKSIIFPTPSEEGKGKLVLPTVDRGVLLGPTSERLDSYTPDDVATSDKGLRDVIDAADSLVPGISRYNWIIKSFAGLRPDTDERDFFIKADDRVKNFITVGAIRSPGLTAAPAIAELVVDELIPQILEFSAEPKERIVTRLPKTEKINELPFKEIARMIDDDPLHGRIVCQCNEVSEREIINAIREGAKTIDGVKFRTRAGFGRCQGSFCGWRIAQILSRELGIELSEVRLNEKDAWILNGKVRP